MTRKECLDKAAECVLKDRQREYGGLEDNFEQIADLWEAYLHRPISPLDVAMCMMMLKIARAKSAPQHSDNYVDMAGYAACAAEIVKADTEFKPGDDVQFKAHAGKDWTDALYERELPAGCGHIVLVSGFGRIAVDPGNIRHAPTAEGCEELVFNETRMRESMPGIVPQDAPMEEEDGNG